jgi:hypothetical protein
MDPITFLAIAAFTAWLVAAPDRATLNATRGGLAAARSAGRAAAGVVRSEWAATAPARSAAWTARKDRLSKTRKGRATLAGIWVLGAGWRATRGGWRITRAAGRATRAGIAAAPDGYRDGARRASDRREQRRTTGHRRTGRWTGRVLRPVAGVPGPAGTGATGGLRVVDEDGRPLGPEGNDPFWEEEFGPDPARVAAADRRRQQLREAGYTGSTDSEGYAVDADWGHRLSDHQVAEAIAAAKRRRSLREAGYLGPTDVFGYAVDADGRRLSDAELAARIAPDHHGDQGDQGDGQGDAEPVVFRCWAKDCTEPTVRPGVFCRGHEEEAARNWVATHGEIPVAPDEDEGARYLTDAEQATAERWLAELDEAKARILAGASAGSTTTDPAGGPADGTTTTTEEPVMNLSTIGSGLLDQISSITAGFGNAGEWETTADLRGEVDQAEELAEAATAVIEALRKWADALEEAYAAAPFHTRAMAESVAAVGEFGGDPAALGEVLVGLRQALDEADALGEAGEALEAAGNVEAFAAQ